MNYNAKLKEMTTKKNYEGAKAYAMAPELELYTAVVTASLSDTFYEKQDERTDRIAQLIGKVSPEFVARLAVYTRTVIEDCAPSRRDYGIAHVLPVAKSIK